MRCTSHSSAWSAAGILWGAGASRALDETRASGHSAWMSNQAQPEGPQTAGPSPRPGGPGHVAPPLTPLQLIVNDLPLRHPARLELHRLEQDAAMGPKALKSTVYVLIIIIVGNLVWHFFR